MCGPFFFLKLMTTTGKATLAGVVSASVSFHTEGVLRAKFMTKIKIAAALLAACMALTGSGWLVKKALTAKPHDPDAQGAQEPKGPASKSGKADKPSSVPPEGGLSLREFQDLHKQLQEPKGEPWMKIPWKLSLREARAWAIKEKKPIFMFAPDGHPLGCT